VTGTTVASSMERVFALSMVIGFNSSH
jgi:hypothetical protein